MPSTFLKLQFKHGVPTRVSRRIHNEYLNMFAMLGNGLSSSLSRYGAALNVGDTTFRSMLQCGEVADICKTSTFREAEQFRTLGYVQPIQVDMRQEALISQKMKTVLYYYRFFAGETGKYNIVW